MTLTREEILTKWDSMKAHERDSWIFYEVLGRMPMDTAPNSYGGFGSIPRIAKDMTAAWEVVPFITGFQLQRKIDGTYTVRWSKKKKDKPYERWDCIESDEAPDAICKAALLIHHNL